MPQLDPGTALFILSTGGVVLWWLLQQKDQSTKEQLKSNREKIAELQKSHDALKLQIAAEYIKRADIEARLERMESAIMSTLREFGNRVDRLRDAARHPEKTE